MITLIKHEEGKITSIIRVPKEQSHNYMDYLKVPPSSVAITTHYIAKGEVCLKDKQPSLFHEFNYSKGIWEINTVLAWKLITDERNSLLLNSDWTQLPDVPLTTKEAWATYRQALRDITLQTDPTNIIWPIPPV